MATQQKLARKTYLAEVQAENERVFRAARQKQKADVRGADASQAWAVESQKVRADFLQNADKRAANKQTFQQQEKKRKQATAEKHEISCGRIFRDLLTTADKLWKLRVEECQQSGKLPPKPVAPAVWGDLLQEFVKMGERDEVP